MIDPLYHYILRTYCIIRQQNIMLLSSQGRQSTVNFLDLLGNCVWLVLCCLFIKELSGIMLTRYITNTLLVKETTHYNNENKTMQSKTRNTKVLLVKETKYYNPKQEKTLLVKKIKHYNLKQDLSTNTKNIACQGNEILQ